MMVKRVIILLVLLMGILGTCYGEEPQDKTIKDLLDKYQDMTYITTAGINRLDYDKEYRSLYVETQKTKDKISNDKFESFVTILDIYNDVKDIWQNHYPNIGYDTRKYLQKKYPDIKTSVNADIFGDYDTKAVISYLWFKAEDKTKELTRSVNQEGK